MKLYLNYFKLRIETFLQYRSAAIAGLTTQFFWGLMMIFIYMALYQNADNVSMNLEQVIAYTWLHQAFYAFLAVRVMDSEIRDSIRSGNVAYEIIRPYNLYYWWYIKCVAKRIASGMLRVMPVIIVALLLPAPYGLPLPATFANFILFIISLFLGVLVVVGISMLVHTLGFYTYNEAGISSMLNSVMEFLAGELVPVALLPMFIQKGTYYLPFRLVCDLPFRLYVGNLSLADGVFGMCIQFIWIVIFIILGNIIMKINIKKVIVQGG